MPAPESQQVTYESLDACAEALSPAGMDIELLQLGPGTGRISTLTTTCRTLTLQRVHIDAPAIRRGSLDKSTVSFAVWDEQRPREGTWCGQPLGTPGVSVFPDEFAATGRHRLSGTVIDVEPTRCLDAAALLEVELAPGWREGTSIHPLPGGGLDGLSQNLSRLETGTADDNTEIEVLSRIITALGHSVTARPRASQRARAFAAAREHIRTCGMEFPTVPEVCQAAGVSLRTLEYAFRERLGMTPVQYLKVYRLNQVRQMLKRRQTRTVADAANAWGFWHMGKFAGDYRRIFGVKPSADLGS